MPNFDFDNWHHEILAALTGIGAAIGWGRVVDWLAEIRRKKAEARAADEAREDEARVAYQAQLHEDWKYLREELRQSEERHRECEEDRMLAKAELYRMREQLQVMQFKIDHLEEEQKK